MAAADMQDTIRESIAENPSWTGGEESSAQGSPAPAPAAPPAPETPAAAPEAERFSDLDPNDLTPDNQEAYKRMQADYTRKMQALAEERRRQAALEQQWADYQAQVGGQGSYPAPSTQDPAPYPADPYNQNSYDESPLYAEVQQIKQAFAEEAQARRLQNVQFQLRDLETSLGRPLKEEEVATTARVMQRNTSLSVEDAYYLAHRKEREAALKRQGAEETLKTLQQARGATPPPSNLAPPPGAGPPPLTNIRSAVNEALESLNIR